MAVEGKMTYLREAWRLTAPEVLAILAVVGWAAILWHIVEWCTAWRLRRQKQRSR